MAEMKSMLWARIVAFCMITSMLVSLFVFMVIDMNPKGEAVKVPGYKPWEKETVELMNQLPLQDGGRGHR